MNALWSWLRVSALATLLLGGSTAGALAQALSTLDESDAPLEINADEGIEWRRDSNQYVARGNARAAQGDLEVYADVLTAHYRAGADGGNEIYQIDAEGNVRILSPGEAVYGDQGRYEVDRGRMVLVGDNLRLETAQDLITARDTLEYWEREQYAVARGNATAVREDKRLRADALVAHLARDADNKLAVDRVDGKGNVQISTPTEYVRGNSGVYYVNQELATLTGAVKITRGENQLNGEYAEVNLRTGVSKLLGAPPGSTTSSRVRGLLMPEKKPGDDDGS